MMSRIAMALMMAASCHNEPESTSSPSGSANVTCDDPHKCFDLGVSYAHGDGVAKDLQKARALYQRACDLGATGGCHNLARMYASGDGVGVDVGRALELFQKACDGGDAGPCYDGGVIYMKRSDYPTAASMFAKACDGGYPPGCANLATLYEQGAGVSKDPAAAKRFHERACKLGLAAECK